MRKKVYVAGPISKGDLKHNVDQATAAFVALAKAGFAPFCPHWSVYSKPTTSETGLVWCNQCDSADFPCRECRHVTTVRCTATVKGNDEMSFDDWMGVDLAWVAVSDAVLRLSGESVGADLETQCADRNGIPVFTNIGELIGYFIAQKIYAEAAP